MRHTVSLPLGSRPVLRAAAVSALLFGSALPAAAQVLIYEGQPGLAPRGYPVPPGAYPPGTYPGGAYAVPQARYPVLPPEEIRAIAQSLGYWNIGAPKLSGRFYLVAASDQEGRALLRVNAFTGRVVSARNIPGGPAVAAPAPYPAPQRAAPPATARAVPPPAPAYNAPAPAMAGTPAPLPPQRPPEATMAAVTPAPAAVAPATPVTGAPVAAAPVPSPAPAAAAPAAQPAPGASANAPAGQTAAQQSANAAPSATPAPPASAAQPQKRKAGAGTATTDSASAGTASVLSRPKGQ